MKRLSLSLLFLLTLHFAAICISAQSQRLAIPAQTFSLIGKNASHDVKAFCLDRHLLIGTPVDFKTVLAGDVKAVRVGKRPLMTLKQALDGGFLIVKGAGQRRGEYSQIDGTQLRFISNTEEPIRIDFTQTVAMGEKESSSPVQSSLLRFVKATQSDKEFQIAQDGLWGAQVDESRLESLGLYGAENIVRNPATTRNAVLAFQIKYGLPKQNGVLDLQTQNELARVEQQEIKTFELLGFKSRQEETGVPSLADNIHAFQAFLGLPETGKMSEPLRATLREYGPLLKQAQNVVSSRMTASELLNQNELLGQYSAPNIITLLRGVDYSSAGILIKTTKGIEYWEILEGQFAGRFVGDEALKVLDKDSGIFAQAVDAVLRGNGSALVYSGIYKSDAKVTIQIGRDKFELTQADKERFMTGALRHPGIDAAIEKMAAAGGAAKPELVIWRSPLAQGQGGDMGKGESPLTPFGYKQEDPVRLAAAFGLLYEGKVKVVIASDILRGLINLRSMPALNRGSQVGLYVDDQLKYSARTIEPIKKDLAAAQIRVLEVGNSATSETNIFIFAGHRDVRSEQLMMRLAKEGHFRDGIIALAVCGTGCDAHFNSLLISKSGARAVIFYDQEINAQAVQDVLLKFAELLNKEGAPHGEYQELWRESVDEVEKNATPALRDEVKKLRNILIQVSSVDRGNLTSDAE